MAIVHGLINLDTLFHGVKRKLVLNTIPLTQSNIKDLIYTAYDDEISMVPQCECGYFKGGYLIGRVCPKCGTTVIRAFENIQPMLWVNKFRDDLKFINPKLWIDLAKIINSKIDSVRWLADTTYNPPTVPPVLHSIKELIGGRGYLNVVNNFENIIIFLKHNSQFKNLGKQIKLETLHKVYKANQDLWLSDFIPLINKKLFIIENTNKGAYTTTLLADIIDLALLVVSVANDPNVSEKKLQNVTAKIISKSGKLFSNYVKDLVSKKGGLVRKNIYGTRAHFTFRRVVSSLRSIYDYDTIHVPWEIGIAGFRPHLLNKLVNKSGYTYKEASAKLDKAALMYDPEIDKYLQELIDESPEKGIPVLANRNPSLLPGSIQKVYITRFKTDLADQTVSISVNIAPSFNMDFDGDELNFTILLDNKMSRMADKFAPHYNVPALDIYKVSGNLNIPKTSLITLMNYLHKKEPEAKPEEDEVFQMLKQISS